MKTNDYSLVKISEVLKGEIVGALQNVEGWGSVEIFVQDNEVTQITVRKIKKTRNKKLNGNHSNITY